jgi:hypothetical protein
MISNPVFRMFVGQLILVIEIISGSIAVFVPVLLKENVARDFDSIPDQETSLQQRVVPFLITFTWFRSVICNP